MSITDGSFTSPIFFDRVIVSSSDSTTGRVLRTSVGGLNKGVTTAQLGLLVPSDAPQASLQLTAVAYLKGVALSPQPAFHWESSNPGVAAVSQSGLVSRVTNNQTLGFDSNGAANLSVQAGESFLGGISNVKATALRPDNSMSGVFGEITIAGDHSAAATY